MNSKQALSFDSVAEEYDRLRPSYPEALYEDLLGTASLAPGARVLEIGSGSGIATLPFAERGFRLTSLEPGAELAQIVRRKLDRFPDCDVHVTTFESWDPTSSGFELVFSAQAFHWLDPETRFERAASVLTCDGTLAIFGNAMLDASGPAERDLRAVYEKYAPELGGPSPTRWYARDGPVADLIRESGLFSEPVSRFYDWSMPYEGSHYLDLLRTHSDYNLLPEETREALLSGIGEVIESVGGEISVNYQSSLNVAQRITRL